MEKSTFKEVFKTYYNPLVNFASNIIGEKDAEDVVQDVFLKIWHQKDEIFINSPKSFLFRAVYNKCIEKIRRLKVEKDYLDTVITKSTAINAIEEVADTFMLKEKINKSLRQLPPKTREVFVLAKVNGLTYREIAEEMKISVKTVENHMSNAFKKLRILISQ
ncbi:MAG: RNA polymerase sigma-70 factor [Saprospiraceae bacterium]|nr:RNA polymerase sigma-70 factor [Saprospiraceae bacterium]